MLIVGELINTSRKVIKENVENRNSEYIQDIAKKQIEAGADYLDVNCSDMRDNELTVMKWLMENIQAVVDTPLCIDTTNAEVMEAGLSLAKNGQPIVNSISGEKEWCKKILPLIKKYGAKVVALCMDDSGIPDNAEDRLRVAHELVKELIQIGVAPDDIYLDPLTKTLSTGDKAGLEVFDSIRLIKQAFPDVHLISAISNISFGLPNRKILNRVFLVQTLTAGMDAFIVDPLDRKLMGYLYASQALLGQDPFCRSYLAAHRKGIYSD